MAKHGSSVRRHMVEHIPMCRFCCVLYFAKVLVYQMAQGLPAMFAA